MIKNESTIKKAFFASLLSLWILSSPSYGSFESDWRNADAQINTYRTLVGVEEENFKRLQDELNTVENLEGRFNRTVAEGRRASSRWGAWFSSNEVTKAYRSFDGTWFARQRFDKEESLERISRRLINTGAFDSSGLYIKGTYKGKNWDTARKWAIDRNLQIDDKDKTIEGIIDDKKISSTPQEVAKYIFVQHIGVKLSSIPKNWVSKGPQERDFKDLKADIEKDSKKESKKN